MSTGDERREGAAIYPATWQKGASIARVSPDAGLLVVADVIEPTERTSFSARLAADVVVRRLQPRPEPERAKGSLLAGLQAAHAALYDPDPRSSSLFALAGAVSLASLLLAGSEVILGTIGSCRCYRKREGDFRCLDRGHSAADKALEQAQTPDEAPDALALEHRDLVTEALGLREEIHPSLGVHPARPGDRFLLCTSAVWTSVRGKALSSAMSEGSPDQARQVLAHLVSPGSGGFALAIAQVEEVSRE